ncbi:hypothetical protein HS088_TW10G00814 [Tripterygium wilfordii]|uniref:RPM1 interacting protein 13 n=1 Tax=Tripterygium wilfordii TaxID=458696 RepID=A0A7J7D675_TRIWF|nr:uncharacterized protein LOC120007418 [Tripterygium wilfordii]XP_038713550.1 uncharacterized protein LOC120007418 [Tripterygium wilfordii]KAF5741808.1 hypothetical protein HS088_TW10G00814 [Tripterygium wilfordii]
MMGSASQVFDISSDEETVVEDVKCNPEDYLWLEEILETVNKKTDDSDEVVVLGEYNSKSQTLKAANIEDDDDCIVLDGDPDKVSRAGEDVNQCDGDSDEVIVVGQKGQIACRDYPHARYLCAKFPFSSTPHESYCDRCHCFVCDSPAPCAHWGNGVSGIRHCHATDKQEFWKAERKSYKLKKDLVPPVPELHDAPLPASLPQVERGRSLARDDISRRTTFRPCSTDEFSVPNIISQGRSQQPGNVCSRNAYHPLPATKQVLGVSNSAIQRSRGSSIGNLGTHPASSNTMFKRPGVVGGPMTNCRSVRGPSNNINSGHSSPYTRTPQRSVRGPSNNINSGQASPYTRTPQRSVRGPSNNINSGHASPYTRTPQMAASNEKNPCEWQNSYPNMSLGSYACCSSPQPNMGNVSVDTVLSYPQVYCQTTSQPNEGQNILGNQSQNPTNPGTSNLGFEWVNSASESNLQPSVGNIQLDNAGQTDGALHVDQFDSCLTRSAGLNYDYHYYESLFSENQSAPVVPESHVPSDDVFSAELTGVDAGMLLFDFETSWNGLTRV